MQTSSNSKGLFQRQNKGKARTEGAAEPDIKKLNRVNKARLWKNKTRLWFINYKTRKDKTMNYCDYEKTRL